MIYPNSKRFIPIYKIESGPEGPDYSTMPLTFEALGDVGISLNKAYYYNKNNTGWNSNSAGTSISLSQGDILQLSGSNTLTNGSSSNHYQFTFTGNGKCDVYGCLHSIDNWNQNPVSYCYYYVFESSKLRYANHLIFPKNANGGEYIYSWAFYKSSVEGTVVLNMQNAYTKAFDLTFYKCNQLTGCVIKATSFTGNQNIYEIFNSATSIQYVQVEFTSWPSVSDWSIRSSSGIWVKPKELTLTRDSNHIPTSWTVLNRVNGNLYYAEQGTGDNVPYQGDDPYPN